MDYIHDLRKIIGPRKIILNCAGALIIRDDRILFQRRTDNGRWGLIGGLLEMNETYEQAALREIREETGLEVKLDDVSVYPLLPYPGTPLYQNPEKYKITCIDRDFSKYYQIYGDKKSGYVFETEDMNLEKLRYYRDYLVQGIADTCPWAIDDEENR